MPKRKLPLLILGLLLGGVIIAFFLLRNEKKVYNYYPKSSFKIPEDVLKERIATEAATTYKIPIIMYHYVEYVADKNDTGRINLSTAPSILEHQIKSLVDKRYNFYFVRDLPDILVGKSSLLPRPMVLTFDDGYEDFYWNVLPLLKKYNAKATLFVMNNFIGRRGYLNDLQVKTIINSGLVEIGAHTLDHSYLKALKLELAWKEIAESKIGLEREFRIPISSFAYPYGAFDKQAIDFVRKAGYAAAVSVVPGADQSLANRYYLYRLRPGVLWGENPAKSLENYLSKR